MKKIYQIPVMTIAEIELQQMIAASKDMVINSTDEALTTETNVAARHTSVWGDEEEEF